jgi:flagellar motor switch protein FliN/FliY
MGDFQTTGGMQPGFGGPLPVMPGTMPGAMPVAPGMEPIPPTAHYQQLQLSEFGPGAPYAAGQQNLNLLYDVPVPITVVLGRSVMRIQEVLGLQPGSVVTLDRNDGEPVDLLIKDKLIAQGEVVVIDGNYGIKITRIVDAERRLEAGTGVMPGAG